MANINILDKSIFNRIAAGEVVERPASIVKELIENSIDAGATFIVVEITEGGIKQIKISDNGHGMNAENLPKAVMPHATSKICAAEDLDKIGTLGFRGEALSSISAVAKVTILSKTAYEETGNKLQINGGEIVNFSPAGAVTGTHITVDDIFYCIPARAKFLKKPKTEEGEITNLISRLILANPNIAIKYIADNKLIYNFAGSGLEEAIYTIYGKSAVENIIPYSYKNNIFTINGYVGKPTFSKPNRTYQTVIINGRYIINKQISAAIQTAYEHFVMKGTFPFYVLHFSIPLDKVDVNVHPNKLDVKFENGNQLFSVLVNSISEVLLGLSHVKQITTSEQVNADLPLHNLKIVDTNMGSSFTGVTQKEENTQIKEVLLESILDENTINTKNSLSQFLTNDSFTFKANSDSGFAHNLTKIAAENNLFGSQVKMEQTNNSDIKIIGTAFCTYIIIEYNNSLYFIDQHAAHERLLYDKFKAFLTEKTLSLQPLLVPYVLNLNYIESGFINDNIEEFKKLGFEIETFGINSFKVNTVPLLLKDISLKDFFNSTLKNVNNNINIKKTDMLEDYLAKFACRSAVKANDNLSENEVLKLIEQLQTGTVLLCPHGRPIIIEISNKEIEKWFKRIV